MTDTLLKLIENHQNEKRSIQKKYFIESSINDTKINLLNSYFKKEFGKGIPYNDFLRIINNEVINCLLYDLVDYDVVIINLGKKTLISMLKDIDSDVIKNKIFIEISNIKNHILNIITVFHKKENILISLEVTDNEARMVIKPYKSIKLIRPNIKFINFPLYNYTILDPVIN